MDFTENHEFFSLSRCVNFNFHGVKGRNLSTTKNFHSRRETNHAVKRRVKFHAVKLKVKVNISSVKYY